MQRLLIKEDLITIFAYYY